MQAISTVNCGAASLASTVARAGVWPGTTQRVPDRVHLGESLDVGEIDRRREKMLLSEPALASRPSMISRISCGLLADAPAGGFVGDLAGEIDRVAVHDGLRHARADADAFDAHGILPFSSGMDSGRRDAGDRAEEVALADIDAGIAQDVVSGRQMEIDSSAARNAGDSWRPASSSCSARAGTRSRGRRRVDRGLGRASR